MILKIRTTEYDLRFLRGALPQLEAYLLSTDVYWPIGVHPPAGEPPYPQLTIGNILLSQLILQVSAKSNQQLAEYTTFSRGIEDLRSRWTVAWMKKNHLEFRARLNLWRDYLDEYRDSPQTNYDRYSYEVGRRVLLTLLSTYRDQIPTQEFDLLSSLDRILNKYLQTGKFIWQPEWTPVFPEAEFWFLYGILPANPEIRIEK